MRKIGTGILATILAISAALPVSAENDVISMEMLYAPYNEILEKYVTAETEKWDMEKLIENDMSALAFYSYKDAKDEVIGFNPFDLDFDGIPEMLIGSMTGDDYQDQIILDAYTLKDGKAEKIFESSERSRYYLMHDIADMRMIANEGSSSASQTGWHAYTLREGKMQAMDEIIYDDTAEDGPWFEGNDDDWDVSNDKPISEEAAMILVEGYTSQYFSPGFLGASQGFFVPDQEIYVPDPFEGCSSFDEMIESLPEGYGYTYAKLMGSEAEHLIISDEVFEDGDGNKVATSAMLYELGTSGPRNVGNCYSVGKDYPIRIKDGILYTAGSREVAASVLSKENGYLMYLGSVMKVCDEEQKVYYLGFLHEDNSLDSAYEDIETESDEEYQKLMEEYESAELLTFTVI